MSVRLIVSQLLCMCVCVCCLFLCASVCDRFMSEATSCVMVWSGNLPYITLTLFPVGNKIHERQHLSPRSTRKLLQVTISPLRMENVLSWKSKL